MASEGAKTVEDRLAKAQAGGDLSEIRAALEDARKAGADPAQIKQALEEVERMAKANAIQGVSGVPAAAPTAPAAAAPKGEGDAPAEPDPAAVAELRARAETLKKQGNELLKTNTKSAAREALESFTDGLEVRCHDNVLNAQLFSNRAHVRILLRQFVEAVDDCRNAIKFDQKNMKAYWRAAKASLHLELCKNGVEFCEAGLRQDPSDVDLMKMKGACAEKLSGQQQRRAEIARTSNQEFNADEAMALQEKVNEFNEQVDSLKHSLNIKKRDHMSHQLTRKNLAEIREDAGTYLSVGRTFLKRDRKELDAGLGVQVESLEEEIPRLGKTLTELEKRKDAAEKELKEMIGAFKQQTDGPGAAGAA